MRYYDEKTPRCQDCAWFGKDHFPDGREYEECGWFGYIFHTDTDERCDAFMNPLMKERYLKKINKNKTRKP